MQIYARICKKIKKKKQTNQIINISKIKTLKNFFQKQKILLKTLYMHKKSCGNVDNSRIFPQ